MKILDYAGLQVVIQKIKDVFVAKDGTKTLTDNNYTAIDKAKVTAINPVAPYGATTTADGLMVKTDKAKLDTVESGAEVNVIETVKRNGTVLTVTDKSVDVAIPVKLSDLTNDTEFKTQAEILNLISENSKTRRLIVETLPAEISAEEGIFYLVPKTTGSPQDGYNEFMLINGVWERVGDTSVTTDLSGYVKQTDLVAITNSEIDAAFV